MVTTENYQENVLCLLTAQARHRRTDSQTDRRKSDLNSGARLLRNGALGVF